MMAIQLSDAHCEVSPRSAAQVHFRLVNPSNNCLLAAMVMRARSIIRRAYGE
jgi:hypothetical protein